MPYIKKDEKTYLDRLIYELTAHGKLDSPAELNYLFTKIILVYLKKTDRTKKPRYQDFNDVIGALECCKLELARRLIVPYENDAIDRNGDVY